MLAKGNKNHIIYFRWVFRIISLILLLLMLMFIFGDGLPDLSDFGLREILLFICFLGMSVGLVYIWFNEKIGSLILLISSILFWIINFIFTGNLWLGFFLLIYPILASAFLIFNKLNPKK